MKIKWDQKLEEPQEHVGYVNRGSNRKTPDIIIKQQL